MWTFGEYLNQNVSDPMGNPLRSYGKPPAPRRSENHVHGLQDILGYGAFGYLALHLLRFAPTKCASRNASFSAALAKPGSGRAASKTFTKRRNLSHENAPFPGCHDVSVRLFWLRQQE